MKTRKTHFFSLDLGAVLDARGVRRSVRWLRGSCVCPESVLVGHFSWGDEDSHGTRLRTLWVVVPGKKRLDVTATLVMQTSPTTSTTTQYTGLRYVLHM
jgi:hypothetical protein